MLRAFCAITWRQLTTSNPVSSKLAIDLDLSLDAFHREVPHILFAETQTVEYGECK